MKNLVLFLVCFPVFIFGNDYATLIFIDENINECKAVLHEAEKHPHLSQFYYQVRKETLEDVRTFIIINVQD